MGSLPNQFVCYHCGGPDPRIVKIRPSVTTVNYLSLPLCHPCSISILEALIEATSISLLKLLYKRII